MEIKNYQIKIYHHYDKEVRKVADCSVKLTIPPKIDKCTSENFPNDVRGFIEATLESELKLPPPNGGVGAILNHYKPLTPQRPVGGKIVDDYSWTIEEVPLEDLVPGNGNSVLVKMGGENVDRGKKRKYRVSVG